VIAGTKFGSFLKPNMASKNIARIIVARITNIVESINCPTSANESSYIILTSEMVLKRVSHLKTETLLHHVDRVLWNFGNKCFSYQYIVGV